MPCEFSGLLSTLGKPLSSIFHYELWDFRAFQLLLYSDKSKILFEFMKLTNQIVIDILNAVPHNEFYVISVNVSIACQISKTLKQGDSDQFSVGNSHKKGNKMNGAFIIALLCMIECIPDKRGLSFLMRQWWEQNPLVRISHTWWWRNSPPASFCVVIHISFPLSLNFRAGCHRTCLLGCPYTWSGPSWPDRACTCTWYSRLFLEAFPYSDSWW